MSSLTTWAGVAKRRYGKFSNPLPSDNTIAQYATFVSQDRRGGENYNFPVKLTHEHGVTPDVSGTAFTLNSAIDSVTKNAQLSGATIMLVGNLPYDTTAALMNGSQDGGSGGSGFFDPVDAKVKNLMISGELYRELYLMYGPGTAAAVAANIGVVNASVSGANLAAPQVVNLTAASWAPGIWNNMTNALVDIYQADGTTIRDSAVTVQAVPDKTKNRITLFKTASVVVVAAGDVIVLKDSRTKSCYGLEAILSNSGSLFGIDAAVYPQWKGVTKNVGGSLTRAVIIGLGAELNSNGLDEGGKLFVSGVAFSDLSEEANELLRIDESKNEKSVWRQGAENLAYRTPCGVIEVAVHRYMKNGEAMLLSPGNCSRVGNTDLTFNLPGTNQWFYQELSGQAGGQFRIYSNQAPVLERPYHCALMTGITSSNGTSPS
jgi:hypothetical protein